MGGYFPMKNELAKLCPEELLQSGYYKDLVRRESLVPLVAHPRVTALQILHIWHDATPAAAAGNYRELARQLENELRQMKGLSPGDEVRL